MADSRFRADGFPIASPSVEGRFDFRLVDGGDGLGHAPILGKNSFGVKEHFTNRVGDAHPVSGKPISQVVAANLRYWMEQAELTQAALAGRAGVNQKTISNYLNPEQRAESATGKLPSPKLEELDKIARALAIPLWQLVREMTEKERRLYEHIERAYSELTSTEAVTALPQRPTATTEAQQSVTKGGLGRLPGEVLRTGQVKGKSGEVNRPGKTSQKRHRGGT
jgi:transcriptional regulator with XRE-family HTH domain